MYALNLTFIIKLENNTHTHIFKVGSFCIFLDLNFVSLLYPAKVKSRNKIRYNIYIFIYDFFSFFPKYKI